MYEHEEGLGQGTGERKALPGENEMSGIAVCGVCFRHCRIPEGMKGFCGVRKNTKGLIMPVNYGIVTGLALDPIEKKPLRRFCPGSRILSVGSFGCNLKCPFCQNHEISQSGEEIIQRSERVMPDELVEMALSATGKGNVGIAFTYNEPLICYEYVRDAAKLAHEKGLKTVIVTNGSVSLSVLEEVLPFTDAMNIDLKGFTQEAYRALSGDLTQTKEFIMRAAQDCHVELTSLIVPTMNDSPEEMDKEAAWIAGISPDIPLHITRYFPMYRMTSEPPTDIALLYRLRDIASNCLHYVYVGNV